MDHHSNFSIRALERVEEKPSMSEEEVGDLLGYNLAVKIAEEKDTNRVHLLFYSPNDFQCFVAVQDVQTKTHP